MTLITAQQALRPVKPKHVDVPFPELGGDIRFIEMTEAEWDAFDKSASHYIARLIVATAQGDGGRLFKDTDINKIVNWPKHMTERAGRAIMKLHGLLGEDMEKNSEPTPPTTG